MGDHIAYSGDEFVIVSTKAALAVKVGEDPFRLDENYCSGAGKTATRHAKNVTGGMYPFDFMMDEEGCVEVVS